MRKLPRKTGKASGISRKELERGEVSGIVRVDKGGRKAHKAA